jgi:serine/threonine protein kinase
VISGETNDNPDELFPSDLKERYHDARLIGKGGMGRVFRANDTRLLKPVAIKLLPPHNEKASAVMRFQQEAKAVSKLNNKHIVQVMDFGFTEDGGEPFLIMEFIQGQDLDSIIEKSGVLPLPRAIEIAIQVCAGLAHAHSNGIVHRDLKPGNIMIDSEDCVRILDFGLAKILSSQEDTDLKLTKPGRPVGSILFMSPEQFQGKEADELSEVYALGLVIYNIVTGTVPCQGDNLMALMRKRREEPPPTLPPSDQPLHASLNDVLQKALAVNPEERFKSMSDFQEALEKCLKQTTDDTEVPAAERDQTTKKFILVAASLILLGLIASFFVRMSAPHQVTHVKRERELSMESGGLPKGFEKRVDESIEWWQSAFNLQDSGLQALFGSDVRNLSLRANQEITDAGIHRIRGLNLIALNIRDTLLGNAVIDDINSFNLAALNIRSTKITEKGLLRLTYNPNMRAIDMKYLPLTDRGLAHIVSIYPNLESINVGFTKVNKDNTHFKVLKKLTKLKKFYGEQVDIVDADAETIISMKVDEIELAANPITRKTVARIMTLPDMKYISLAGCKDIPASDLVALKRKFPKADIAQPVHGEDSVPPDAIEMFSEADQ